MQDKLNRLDLKYELIDEYADSVNKSMLPSDIILYGQYFKVDCFLFSQIK